MYYFIFSYLNDNNNKKKFEYLEVDEVLFSIDKVTIYFESIVESIQISCKK